MDLVETFFYLSCYMCHLKLIIRLMYGAYYKICNINNSAKIYNKYLLKSIYGITTNGSLLNSETFHSLSRCSTGYGYFNVDTDGTLYSCTHTVGDDLHKIGSLIEAIRNM